MKPGERPIAKVDMARRGSEPSMEGQQTSYMLFNKQNYGLELLTRLNAFRGEGAFTDAILCVGQEEFPCHRNVLAVSSPYFRAMFTSDLKESREARIPFNDVSPWTLKRVIDYAYSGRLEITVENAEEMLAAGGHFQYPDIVGACCEFLQKQLHQSNCLGIEALALLHGDDCKQLQEQSNKFTLENFSCVVECDEFLDQPVDRVITYVSSDLIDVRTEETVLDAALRWIKYDLDERQVQLPHLLEHLRLPVLDISTLQSMEKDPLIRGNEKSLEMVHDAMEQHESIIDQHGRRRRSMQNAQIHPRPSTVAKEVLVVVGGINSYITKSVEMYDLQKNKWMPLPDFPKAMSWFCVGAVNNSIIVTGGILDGHIVPHVWKFDVVKRTWHQVESMHKPRAHHASAVLDDYLYVIGGITDGNNVPVDIIERYDPYKNCWTKVGEANFPRRESQIVAHNNTLVEVGGLQGDARVKTMDSYLCAKDLVKPAGEQFILPESIQFSEIVSLHGIFYIIWEDSKKVIALNPLKRTFRRLPDMQHCHLHCSAVVLNEKIYVTGGQVDGKPSNVVECYDPVANKWTIEKSMIESRAFHGCVCLQMC
ncbi:kelch-like protein 21 [Haliotis cracherodii]|uniref:kelch-like protein 21 n=1 Tax=Haliotis cracherodii TaxID=6455 RepID=UPI0039EBB03D